jgi:hypothetical protein
MLGHGRSSAVSAMDELDYSTRRPVWKRDALAFI